MDSLKTALEIKEMIDDKLGEDIVCLDLQNISSVTDYMIIATGKADTHVKSIAESLIEDMKKKHKVLSLSTEGLLYGTWVCVDYGDVIVHVMRKEERELYDLQAIWGNAPKV